MTLRVAVVRDDLLDERDGGCVAVTVRGGNLGSSSW